MALFAVSYINWFGHELSTRFMEAENEIECYRNELKLHEIEEIERCKEIQDFKHLAFDCDCMIHVERVPTKA